MPLSFPTGRGGLYVPQAPLERRGPLLALGPHHRKGSEPLQGHGPAGPAGVPTGRVDHGGTTLEGERKLYLQQLSVVITPEKRTGPSAKGGVVLFPGQGGVMVRPPDVYHLKGLCSVQEIDRIYTLILIHPLHPAILRNKDRKGVGCKCVEQR